MLILVGLLFLGCTVTDTDAAANRLSREQAELLMKNAPDFLRALKLKRCPTLEVLWKNENEVAFQLRSICSTSPSGLIGNYIVDLETAEVWSGFDRDYLLQSKSLGKTQRSILKQIRR